MTPREKASELIVNYQLKCKSLDYQEAKLCALIVVDEVLDYLNKIMIPNPFGQYWDEVRKEVENL